MKSVLGDITLFAGAMLILACGSLTGLLSGNKTFDMVSVFIGLVLGPFLVCYSLATMDNGGVWKRAAKVLGVLLAGTTIVLANFQAENLLGKDVGEALMTISRALLFAGVLVTGLVSVAKGIYNEENKEYWQRRTVPFAQTFLLPGFALLMPLISFSLFEAISVRATGMALLEDLFGSVGSYWLVIAFGIAGMAGAALLAIPVLVRLFHRPGFKLGKDKEESSLRTALLVYFVPMMAAAILLLAYFVAQKAGMLLYVQQVGTNEVPFYFGLCVTVLAVSVTSMVALWRVENYVPMP